MTFYSASVELKTISVKVIDKPTQCLGKMEKQACRG